MSHGPWRIFGGSIEAFDIDFSIFQLFKFLSARFFNKLFSENREFKSFIPEVNFRGIIQLNHLFPCRCASKDLTYLQIWQAYLVPIRKDGERKKTFIDMSAFTLWTVHLHLWDRPLSSFGPSTFILWTVHFHPLDRPLSPFGPSTQL